MLADYPEGPTSLLKPQLLLSQTIWLMPIFVNAVDLRMSECDFNSWMFQLANENWESYRLGMKLQNYTMAIEMEVGIPINFNAERAYVHIRKSWKI